MVDTHTSSFIPGAREHTTPWEVCVPTQVRACAKHLPSSMFLHLITRCQTSYTDSHHYPLSYSKKKFHVKKNLHSWEQLNQNVILVQYRQRGKALSLASRQSITSCLVFTRKMRHPMLSMQNPTPQILPSVEDGMVPTGSPEHIFSTEGHPNSSLS